MPPRADPLDGAHSYTASPRQPQPDGGARDSEPPEPARVSERWLPPEPHRSKVLEMLASGRATLQAQGHDRPPLLLFEDGGAMELPRARWRSRDLFVADEKAALERTTAYSDVCGAADAVLATVNAGAAGPEALRPVFADMLAMLRRMRARLGEYELFAAELAGASDELRGSPAPPVDEIDGLAGNLADLAGRDPAALIALAEDFRRLAQAQEDALRDMQAAAMRLGAAYQRLRGARPWDAKSPQSAAAD